MHFFSYRQINILKTCIFISFLYEEFFKFELSITRNMKANSVILIFLLIPVFVNAQFKFRPILDPSALCNEEIKPKQHILNPFYDEKEEPHSQYHIFYIVEKMPEPKVSAEDIEDILGDVVRFNNQEKTLKTTMHFQCVVNCRGEAGRLPDNLLSG
jgi:hypothetical protein